MRFGLCAGLGQLESCCWGLENILPSVIVGGGGGALGEVGFRASLSWLWAYSSVSTSDNKEKEVKVTIGAYTWDSCEEIFILEPHHSVFGNLVLGRSGCPLILVRRWIIERSGSLSLSHQYNARILAVRRR